ncbi:alpha-amylase family glycosyl hydrolase [Portibacter lacus]|uniref:Glycosyl hydrolase family 13 catalytic domain-containing protein n=1 Tax=Portibacter lacus TaxID=1099794 RepID=A0AA37WBD8_9BACT|nr:alpha-amylase family glycosyl hydrolase [Portibacter lacus]GLR15551.1 hypothetical protein GCM10007940_01660 [Portibacter lacus]
MKKLILFFLLISFYANGQVVRTEPAFPSQFDDITVYFDAKLGDGGLEGFTGDVYAHTGVITNQSSGPTDWKNVQGEWGVAFPKTKMTPEGNDIYSIAYNIETFYGISDDVTVESLSFVFRSTDGSVTGRDEGGKDIYAPVYPPETGLLLTVVSPNSNGNIYFPNDSVAIEFVLNDSAWVTVTDNETLVFGDSTMTDQFYIHEPAIGLHKLVYTASNADDTIEIKRNFIVLEEEASLVDLPFEAPLGFSYPTDSTYLFQLYAPGKEYVFLLTPDNNFDANLSYQLNKSVDEATFWILLNKSEFVEGQTMYQYLVDGSIRIPDPYSTVVLDPNHDGGVPADVMAELPDYPEGQTEGIVTAFDYEKDAFEWTNTDDYEQPEQTNLVIYEMLMRDFLDDRNFKSLIDTLDYFEKLGVNAIELMPITEFEANQSWGYNVSFHMALDKYYGSRKQFKEFVNAAHERGISVILDVVYNHVFSQSPLAQLYWDPTNFRPSADNPWLNVIPKHPFNVGYDVNHESLATKTWVKQTLGYWMEEFHIDGFRFDLTKGFTQLNSGENADLMAQYDPGRINILKDYADYVWSVNEDAYVILEHFAYNEEELELANYGMMLWGNMNHEFIEAALENKSDLEWLDYTVRGWDSPHAVGYMESHDEERLMVRLLDRGFSLERALERIETASSIFYMVPGPKMLWEFGELGFDYSINWCTNGTIGDCRLDPKPVVWEYLEEEDRAELNDVVSDLIHLKTNYPTFSTSDFTFNDANQYLKTIHFNHDAMDALVMANFRDREQDFIPKFQYTGVWYEYFTGDSLIVENVEDRVELLSGEYRIYTSERITPPNGFSTSVSESDVISGITVFPNPIRVGQRLYFTNGKKVDNVEVYDHLGRLVRVEHGKSGMIVNEGFLPGIYFLKVYTDQGIECGSFVVK